LSSQEILTKFEPVNDRAQILIITVNFRQAECTRQFLYSASRLANFASCNVLIVDNGSDDGSTSRIREAISEFPNVELLPSAQNRGYFGAARWALDQYLEHHSLPGWVAVCNNDIEFDDSFFLVQLLDKDPASAGVLAPSIISNLTGHDANPFMGKRPGSFRMEGYRLWLANYYAMWLKQWLSPSVRRIRHTLSRRMPTGIQSARRSIYAPHGSFVVFSRRFFEAGGFIDDGFFLYAEEFSIAEMSIRLGQPVIHEPTLRVRHKGGQSTGRMLSRDMYLQQVHGFRYALSRYKDSYPEIIRCELNARSNIGTDRDKSPNLPAVGDGV
jgi:GT2 family glycosyltransferase